jgi:cysteinyl-tRNA synthetase
MLGANTIVSVREVRIRDTLSGEVRPLDPPEPGRVGIYACGPTTYARIHVGNARPYVVFMLLKRFLEHEGNEVTLVVNVTDINDKIYDAAREAGRPSAELADEMTRAYLEDTERLGLGRPDEEPLASETIPEIVALIEALIASGHAYRADGDVYFRVRSFDGYGKLSNRDPEEMDQGEEAGTESLKEDRLDFALWKARKPDEDTAWDSPWGPGRPGWHIECSAMAEKYLGPEFALHGGGADLVFPHHENEIAQTEAARGVPLARLWMHNGMVRVAEEKMAKSVGNIFQLAEALDEFAPETLVAYLISGHYRQPLEFSAEALREAEARVERIRNFLREDHPAGDPAAPGREVEEAAGLDSFVAARREEFLDALADDFNTPRALAALFQLIAEGNKRPLPGARAALEEMLPLVGLESLLEREAGADPESLELLAERERARAARDFERADRIRDELAQRGWEVRDAPEGARLVRRG